MKQTTIQFEKRRRELVTIQRLQQAVDLIAKGTMMSEAMKAQGLSPGFGKFLESARILARVNHKTVVVLKPKLERKDYYRVMELQKKYHQKSNANRVSIPKTKEVINASKNYLDNPKGFKYISEVQEKKAVALPWWKRFLLYLANH